MSRNYQPKNKEYANILVVSTEFYRNNSKNYNFIGSVHRGHTAFITTQRNRDSGSCSFIDDTSCLTKKTKNEIVRFFSSNNNSNKKVVYLVKIKK